MRQKIFILFTGLLAVFFLSATAALSFSWTQVNTSGFGDTKNYSAYRMITYNSRIYVGIWGDNGAQVWEYDGSTWSNKTPSWDTNNAGVNSLAVFNNKLYVGTYNGTTGAEIWEYDGSNWTQVNTDGFGNLGNYAADSMSEYNTKLYAGVGFSSGVRVWRYDGGTTWTQVNADGFGDTANARADIMTVYAGNLYVGTMNSSVGTEIWRTAGSGGPPFTDWTKVNTPGFGDWYNFRGRSIAVYGGYLYVGTDNSMTGAEVWRTAGSGGPPFTDWTKVNTPAFGDFNNYAAKSMAVYNGRLYVGTDNSATGGEVWEYDGFSWNQVNTDGFGDLNNVYANSMSVRNNGLYVGTYNTSTGSEVWIKGVPPGTYYVDVNQISEGDGSAGNPWKTLHYAIQQINSSPSGTYLLNVAAGTYSIGNGESDQLLTITQDNVTVVGESGILPILDGTSAINWSTGITVAAKNVTIKLLRVENFSEIAISANGVDGIEVMNNQIIGTGFVPSGIQLFDNTNFEITENEVEADFGKAIEISGGTGSITLNNIYAAGVSLGEYGVYIYNSSPLVENNVIRRFINGIYVDASSPLIKKNRIYDNQFGIYVQDSGGSASPEIQNNLIYDTDGSMDYGIYLLSIGLGSVNPNVFHNTIDGGNLHGIYLNEILGGSLNPLIKYNIITNFGEYGIYGETPGYGGSPTFEYNDVFGNSIDNYSSEYTDPTGTNGNISQDPLFGSYYLQKGSPCIDAIPTAAADPVTVDLVGFGRPNGTGHDMGSYEFGEPAIETQEMFLSPITGWYPCPNLTITDGNPPTITAANDIRITIPATLNTTWLVTGWGTISGSAAAKIDQNSANVQYFDNNRTLVIDVTSDFVAGDDLQISFICHTETAAGTSSGVTGNVGLSVNADSIPEATDPYTWTVAVISLSSAANQTFQVGDPPTDVSTITITDDATNATIKTGGLIQLEIPSGFNMTWDTSVTTAVIGGTTKVNTSVTYSGANKIVYLQANTDFLPGESFTVSGLKFTNFTDISSASSLRLNTDFFASTYDDKTIEIIAATVDSDGDGMPDSWETTHFGDLGHDGTADTDGDGLTDLQDYQNSTDPNDPDSDRDGYSDGEEVANSKDPNDSGDKPQYGQGDYYAAADNPLWGDGTQSNPWNLHTAIHHINEGPAGTYTLNLAAGIYQVTGATEPDTYLIIMQDNVTIQGAGAGSTTLDGTGATNWLLGIDIEASNVIIKDLGVRSFQLTGINIYSGTGNIIQACDVYENIVYGTILVEVMPMRSTVIRPLSMIMADGAS
jgi:parallel beta-helix repeat protein